MLEKYPEVSFGFEIVDASDPHIIVEDEGLFLLNARAKQWGAKHHLLPESQLDDLGDFYGIMRPQWEYGQFGDFVDVLPECNHEGFVCYERYGDNPQELKMKTPYYLATKFLGRINTDKLVNSLIEDGGEALKKRIDEEFYFVVDYLRDNFAKFSDLKTPERVEFIRDVIYEYSGWNDETENS